MDCAQVIQSLWTYLDGELDEETYRGIEAHLRKCLRCKDHADFEQRLREIIRECCRKEHAPATLRERLLALLAESSQSGDATSGH